MNKQLIDQAIEALEEMAVTCNSFSLQDRANAAIAALRAGHNRVVEPVAWLYEEATYQENDLRGRKWKCNQFSTQKPYTGNNMVRNLQPLYAHPPAQPASEPLTDDQCRKIYNAAMKLPDRTTLSVMRFIEREIKAHRIGGEV
jgi:hypothetical protein